MTALTIEQAVDKLEQTAPRSIAEEKAALKMSTAKTRLVLATDEPNCVFFASCVMRLKFDPDWTLDTAGTDGRVLIYNPDFILAQSDKKLKGCLAHEVLHCVNKHFARMLGREPGKWNRACDLAINPIIEEAGLELPDNGLFPGRAPYEKLPVGLSAEEYYALLPDEPEDKRGDPKADPGGCGGVMMPKDSNGAPDPVAAKQSDHEWSANLAAAHQMAKRCKRGTLSAGIDRMVAAALEPVHDWKAQLREFLTRAAKNDFSWKRPNRRYIHSGTYLPSRHSMEIGHVVTVVDTSGSIGGEELTRFASELADIARQGVSKLTIAYADSQVCRVDTWTPEDGDLTLNPSGGGGTSHEWLADWVDSLVDDDPPAVIVCLTDCYTVYGEAPKQPVLWAVVGNKNAAPPYGEVIHIVL